MKYGVSKIFKAALFDYPSRTVVSDKMSDGNGVEVKLVKAVANDGFCGFRHNTFPPIIFCENITDFLHSDVRKARDGYLVRIFNSYAADDLFVAFVNYCKDVFAFDEL